jgi:hypothetical protein
MKTKTLKAIPKKGTVASLEKNTMIFLALLSIFSSVAITLIEHCCDDELFYISLIKNILLGIVGSGLVSIVVVFVPYISKKKIAIDMFYKDAVEIYFIYNNIINALLFEEKHMENEEIKELLSDIKDINPSKYILEAKESIQLNAKMLSTKIAPINQKYNELEFESKDIKKIIELINKQIILSSELICKLYNSQINSSCNILYSDKKIDFICYVTKNIYVIVNNMYPYSEICSVFRKHYNSFTKDEILTKTIIEINNKFLSESNKANFEIKAETAKVELSMKVLEYLEIIRKNI